MFVSIVKSSSIGTTLSTVILVLGFIFFLMFIMVMLLLCARSDRSFLIVFISFWLFFCWVDGWL